MSQVPVVGQNVQYFPDGERGHPQAGIICKVNTSSTVVAVVWNEGGTQSVTPVVPYGAQPKGAPGGGGFCLPVPKAPEAMGEAPPAPASR